MLTTPYCKSAICWVTPSEPSTGVGSSLARKSRPIEGKIVSLHLFRHHTWAAGRPFDCTPIVAHSAAISPPLRLPRRPRRMIHLANPGVPETARYIWRTNRPPRPASGPSLSWMAPIGEWARPHAGASGEGRRPTARLAASPCPHRRSTAPTSGGTSLLGASTLAAHKSNVVRTYDAPNEAPSGALEKRPGRKAEATPQDRRRMRGVGLPVGNGCRAPRRGGEPPREAHNRTEPLETIAVPIVWLAGLVPGSTNLVTAPAGSISRRRGPTLFRRRRS